MASSSSSSSRLWQHQKQRQQQKQRIQRLRIRNSLCALIHCAWSCLNLHVDQLCPSCRLHVSDIHQQAGSQYGILETDACTSVSGTAAKRLFVASVLWQLQQTGTSSGRRGKQQ
jgi:hypothetical protein